MRRPIAFFALAALAACGSPEPGNRAAAPASPGNDVAAPAPPGNSAAPGDEAAGLARFRATWLEACIGGAREAAPPGAPYERHCGCAIDRVMAGQTLAQLEEGQTSGTYRPRFLAEMRACIREIPS